MCVPLLSAPGCSLTINQTLAGTFLLIIDQAGVPVGCAADATSCPNPYQVVIAPGPPDVGMSFVAAPASLGANAGDTVAFGMYVQDIFGNPGSSADVQLQLQLPNTQAVVTDITQVSDAFPATFAFALHDQGSDMVLAASIWHYSAYPSDCLILFPALCSNWQQ